MSKIIKSSRIIGEYRLQDIEIEEEKAEITGSDLKKYSEQNSKNNGEKVSLEQINKKLTEAEEEAQKIIKKAKKEAKNIINSAENESEEIKEKAYEEGYETGFKKGKKEGQEQGISQLKESIDTVKEIKNKLSDELEQEKEKLPEKVINLALMIARKLIKTTIEKKPEIINNIVKDMLEKMTDGFEEIKIKVAPELVNYISQEELKTLKYDADIEMIPDESLEQGDCIIETNYGGKDGTLENKLTLVEKELLKE